MDRIHAHSAFLLESFTSLTMTSFRPRRASAGSSRTCFEHEHPKAHSAVCAASFSALLQLHAPCMLHLCTGCLFLECSPPCLYPTISSDLLRRSSDVTSSLRTITKSLGKDWSCLILLPVSESPFTTLSCNFNLHLYHPSLSSQGAHVLLCMFPYILSPSP